LTEKLAIHAFLNDKPKANRTLVDHFHEQFTAQLAAQIDALSAIQQTAYEEKRLYPERERERKREQCHFA